MKPLPLACSVFHPNIFTAASFPMGLGSTRVVNGKTMDALRHWENIYGRKAADAVSWYGPHLETSLELIERAAPEYSTSIIDIGGGESTGTLLALEPECADRFAAEYTEFFCRRNLHARWNQPPGVRDSRDQSGTRHRTGAGGDPVRSVARDALPRERRD